MPCPPHSPWFEYKLRSSPLFNFLHSPVSSSRLHPNILLSALFSKTLSYALPSMLQTKFHIHTKLANYGFVYFNLYAPRQQTGGQKTLNRMVTSIPWI
jgi:hypothetical protein